MFTVTDVPAGKGTLQYREEHLTGLRCRISPERLKRHIDQSLSLPGESTGCPFCRENIFSITPTFADGNRIIRGESVTFPNMFPFAEWHTVTVITRYHVVPAFTRQQIADALMAQTESLLRFDGYPSINWNYLPSAGASIVHPHLQGISDRRPTWMTERYLSAGKEYHAKTGTGTGMSCGSRNGHPTGTSLARRSSGLPMQFLWESARYGYPAGGPAG